MFKEEINNIDNKLTNTDKKLLEIISSNDKILDLDKNNDEDDNSMKNEIDNNISKYSSDNTAYNIRKDGKGIVRKITDNVNIVSKKELSGIDIIVKENTNNEFIHIPVIITKSGLKDIVYNDFYIGKNAKVTIIAGCGIHNESHEHSEHNGIHRFYLEEGAKVKYIENHYGEGKGTGKKNLNPVTEVYLKDNSLMEMDTMQIKGVTFSERITKAVIGKNANFIVNEKIMTNEEEYAKTIFEVELNGKNSSTHVTSRSVATENSKQEFISKVYGNEKSFAHVECDAIIKDNAIVKAIPEITANNADANLIHEAAIGKIAGEQLIKLMTLGLSEKEAEKEIIKGFLK